MKYFDAHTHVHFAAYENDYREVIRRALAAEVGMILVGTQKDTSAHAIEVAREFENDPVYAAVGLHPIHTEKSYHDEKEMGGGEAAKEFTSRGEEFDYAYYKKLVMDKKVVAIGECGLDYYRLGDETKTKQAKVLEAQIVLAYEVKKPLMIHCRNAFGDLIALLKTNHSQLNTPFAGVIHFFTGSRDDADALRDLGFSFTFGGVITFTRDYDKAIKFIPTDRILSETDAPYVSPAPYRGKRNEPAYIIETVKKLAELKNISEEKMAERIMENAKNIFSLI